MGPLNTDKTQWTTSVCTGSLVLAAAGLLKARETTTHWAALNRLQHFGAKPIQKRIVASGKIIIAACVLAGIDMALLLAAKLSGEEIAKTLQLGIEYDPDPPFDHGSPKKAEPKLLQHLRGKMVALFEEL